MSKVNQSGAPYYNTFDPNKNYQQVLVKPGKALQARELNEIQSILTENLRRLSGVVLSEGAVISGLGFTIRDNKMYIEAGQVYLEGLIRNVHAQVLDITGEGTEYIGAKLVESVITYEHDETLRDLATGFKNYGRDGADRLLSTVELVINDSDAITIHTLEDGAVRKSVSTDTQLALINSLLARRTYDESGNYKVNGLTLRTEESSVPDHMYVVVDSGKAYVNGAEVHLPVSSRVLVPLSQATQSITGEEKVFLENSNRYTFYNTPVASVERLQAEVRVTKEIMRKGTLNGRDELSKYSVVKVERVWTETTGGVTEYYSTANQLDYQLVNGHYIDWNNTAGNEPAPGSTYYATYVYNKTLDQGTEFQLVAPVGGEKYIEFLNGGEKPIPNSIFSVDYNFYLSRKDLISLTETGAIVVTQGTPDVLNRVVTPINTDSMLLHLGTVTLYPDSTNSIINSYAITRLSMGDLQGLARRIADIEYNQAIQALDNEAMSGEDPTELRGILSDGFFNLDKADLSHPDFGVTFDIEEGTITLPVESVAYINPVFSNTTGVHVWDRVITAPKTDEVIVEQPFATEAMLVNPYNVFNKLGVLVLSPAVDNFINEDAITINKVETKTYTVHRWWYHGGDFYNDTERYLFQNLKLDAGQTWDGWDDKTGTILSNSARVLLDEAATYMRQIWVTVTATNLLPLSDNLTLEFDGKIIEATPISNEYRGSNAGTGKSDANGICKVKFLIPSKTPVGVREVALKNANNTAIGSFTSYGRNRVVEKTVLTTKVTVYPYDPLAQTFQLDQQRLVSQVGLYFGTKDPSNNCIIQIRNVVNGYPGTTIYAEKVVTPSQITTSARGTVETIVKFDNPVLCEAGVQYCIVVLTDSDTYTLFIAELGKTDLQLGTAVTRQPYLAGTLFSSSNALTWTAHQTMDMKFKLYACKFQTTGSLEFQIASDITADKLVLLSEYLTPNNTGCEWYIRYVKDTELQSALSGKVYEPIANYSEMDLATIIKAFQLKCVFKSSPVMSPVLAKDALSVIGISTGVQGSYVSRTVNFPEESAYSSIKMIFEGFIPNGSRVVPSYSTGGPFTPILDASSIEDVDIGGGWRRYTFTASVLGTPATSFKAKLTLSADGAYLRPKIRKFMNICK